MNPPKAPSGLIYHLGKLRFVHKAVDKSGLYRLVNFLLAKWPRQKTLPRSGAVLRIGSVAGFALAEEMFQGRGYLQAVHDIKVTTFADLGCNVGWFPCFLMEAQPGSEIVGLLMDADPEVVEEANWHLKKNQLNNCEAIVGAVGCDAAKKEMVFHINPANTQSSLKPFGENHPFPVKGKVREIHVPALDLSVEWTKRHDNRPIDLLKIDIEGAELDFIRKEINFIQQAVKRIVCEWHGWHVTLPEIETFLASHGFVLVEVAEQNELAGVAIFGNTRAGLP